MSYSILEAIGQTPLVEINHLNPNPNVKILAKLEYLNPGGSIKDRAALFMIEAGEKSGELTPGKTVIEATSGNTGIGLALVCAVKGYKLLLTMSEAASKERQKILKARGADILLTPGHLGTDGAIEEVYRLGRENPEAYFMTDQFNNPANWQAHYHTTAQEIWEQTGGNITTLVATMGTSGTLMGLERRLKELNPAIEIIGVEPYLGHKIQGLKNMHESYQPEIYEKRRLDQKINIDDEEAFETTRQLASVEGLFVGMSSGAAMAIARSQAQQMESGTVVVIFPDSGERYLSTSLFALKQQPGVTFFNTLNRRKELFEPKVPGRVSVYSCGPTVDTRIDLGACRRFVFSDLLCRYLQFRGHDVNHVVNITDLDDKTIQGSQKAGMDLKAFTQKNIDLFHGDLETLGINPANRYPKASDHTGDMVKIIEELVEKGYAYEKLRSLYFNISRVAEYGCLSGIDLDKIRLGATVDLDEYEKDNPRDFTLLKRTKLSELKRGIYTKTQWGNVRPSWHVQCAAMSMKYLGENFDIHTSGRELVFPHHENEIAIARALTGKLLARYWLHSESVLINGKATEVEGETLTLDDLTDTGYSGREIRYWFLSSHYRKPLEYSAQGLKNARRSLRRLNSCISSLENIEGGTAYPDLNQLCYDLKHGFTSAMDEDLNISATVASLFKMVKKINILLAENRLSPDDATKVLTEFRNINAVLNVIDFHAVLSQPEIQQLKARREKARQEKDWATADNLRGQLEAMGVTVKDRPMGKGTP
jgi:cysteinyl-tRNA synthetase